MGVSSVQMKKYKYLYFATCILFTNTVRKRETEIFCKVLIFAL